MVKTRRSIQFWDLLHSERISGDNTCNVAREKSEWHELSVHQLPLSNGHISPTWLNGNVNPELWTVGSESEGAGAKRFCPFPKHVVIIIFLTFALMLVDESTQEEEVVEVEEEEEEEEYNATWWWREIVRIVFSCSFFFIQANACLKCISEVGFLPFTSTAAAMTDLFNVSTANMPFTISQEFFCRQFQGVCFCFSSLLSQPQTTSHFL
ncbi:hypothetical protein V8G54_015779 [Vigna mungo]|uniref:Uncharacterized protein n=1 Tax=Vigna mungo TaxID=3915 RepID=A0AAQ3NJ33_VIGMU